MDAAKFPNNLRSLRIAKHLTQKDMAEKLNIGRQTYCNYENGKRQPSLELLVSIAEILEVNLGDLVTADLPIDF